MGIASLLNRILKRFDARWVFFRSIPPSGRVLELGCGRGGNCQVLREINLDLEIHGVDLLPDSEIPPFIQYRQHNLETGALPYPDSYFDAILFIHVIEHLRDTSVIRGEIKRLLKQGGTLYVETPNFTSIFVPSFGFRRDQHHPFNFFDDQSHVHPFTKQALFEFVERCGFEVRKVACARNWLRIPVDLIRIFIDVFQGDRPKVVSHFWNLYGWNIYAVGVNKPPDGAQDL